MGVCFADNLRAHIQDDLEPKIMVGAAEGPPPKIILYLTIQTVLKTDPHTEPYTGVCGVPLGVRWVSPRPSGSGVSPGGPLVSSPRGSPGGPQGFPWGDPQGGPPGGGPGPPNLA